MIYMKKTLSVNLLQLVIYVIVLASLIKNLNGWNIIISSFWVRDIWKDFLLRFLFVHLPTWVCTCICVYTIYARAYWKCYKRSNYNNSKNIWLYNSTVSSIAGSSRGRAHTHADIRHLLYIYVYICGILYSNRKTEN